LAGADLVPVALRLPLVPGYVSLISGAGVDELKSTDSQLLRKLMLNSAAFIIGFSIVFIALGALSTELADAALLQVDAGAGRRRGHYRLRLHLTGIFKIKWLYTDARLHRVKGGSTPWGAFVIVLRLPSGGRRASARSSR